jgi:hypothetical protein
MVAYTLPIAVGATLALVAVAAISPLTAALLLVLFVAAYVAVPPTVALVPVHEHHEHPVYPVAASDPVEDATATEDVAFDPLAVEPSCGFQSSSAASIQQRPTAFNASDSAVLGDEGFEHPGKIDRLQEQLWFASKSPLEEQQDAVKMHRSMRRDQGWSSVARWTKADKAKYERARKQLEAQVAQGLRPDKYSIVERDPDADYSSTSNQPFAAILSNHDVFNAGHHRQGLAGSGGLASRLRTKF